MRRKIIITAILVATFFTSLHLLIANSDGVEVASKYLTNNLEVVKEVGEVSQTSLIPLASEVRDYSSEGRATYHIKIVGIKGSVEGVVTSTKSDGKWRVDRAHLLLKNKNVIILKQ